MARWPQVVLIDLDLDGFSGSIPTRLHELYGEMSAFCRAHQISLHMSGLTRTLLSYEVSYDFPCGRRGYGV